MKIGRETIPGLTQRNTAGGLRYYWEPSPAQRRAGWRTTTLPADLAAAVVAAKRRNAELDEWKSGGAKPRQIARFVKAQTFGAVLQRYERDVLAKKQASTQRVDRTAIGRLRTWAGDKPFNYITRARVRALRDAMMDGVELHGPGHAPAFHLLTTGRKICAWWIKEQDLGTPNPFEEFGLPAPDPRDEIWEADAQAILCRAAIEADLPSIALAFRIGTYIGQRQADILGFTRARWKEIPIEQLDGDDRLYERLASDHGPDAGKVMGVHVRQGKTKVWVGIPIEGALRDDIEAAIAAGSARARATDRLQAQHIILKDGTDRPWGQSDFIHTFAEVRDFAVMLAIIDGDEDLAERLATLQFRDLRRTCIVTLGQRGLNDYTIGSISGHSQASIKKILEVYMPRTIAAAARGVVARLGPGDRGAKVEKLPTRG